MIQDTNDTQPTNMSQDAAIDRDSSSLRIIGWFFVVLGVLVLIATCWALEHRRAIVVNLGSGTILALTGVVMIYIARRLRARLG